MNGQQTSQVSHVVYQSSSRRFAFRTFTLSFDHSRPWLIFLACAVCSRGRRAPRRSAPAGSPPGRRRRSAAAAASARSDRAALCGSAPSRPERRRQRVRSNTTTTFLFEWGRMSQDQRKGKRRARIKRVFSVWRGSGGLQLQSIRLAIEGPEALDPLRC